MVKVEADKIVGVRIFKNEEEYNDIFNGMRDQKTDRYLEFNTYEEFVNFIKQLNKFKRWFDDENNEG